jgi:hypothetical protein
VADWTRADLIDDVLTRLKVKAAGESASADDAKTAGDAADGAYEKLRGEGLAGFEISAIPEWAQTDMSRLVCAEIAEEYVPDVQKYLVLAAEARRSLRTQQSRTGHNLPIRACYY